jgi:hypothetical protein
MVEVLRLDLNEVPAQSSCESANKFAEVGAIAANLGADEISKNDAALCQWKTRQVSYNAVF